MQFPPFEHPKDEIFDDRKNLGFGSRLGIYTNTQVPPQILGLAQYDEVLARVERYLLQDIACSILTEKEERTNKEGVTHLTYKHRVNICLKQRISALKPVSVRYNEKRKKAHFDNVQRCGSVWTCPICAMKVSEERRKELHTAMANGRKKGLIPYLVTFTNRHHVGDDLGDLLDGQKKAFIKLWEKTKVKKMMKNLGLVGRISATEVTHGQNGWHPHYHMIFFFDGAVNMDGLRSFLAIEWQLACGRAEMKLPSLTEGVDVRDGSYAEQYVSKWGLEHEMTKGHIKKGREGGLTPFDLLRLSPANPEYRGLFKQFANVFFRKRQLVWSDGLKELLGVIERSDEELAEETENDSVEIDEIVPQFWRLIVSYKIRPQYLRACELDYEEGNINRRRYNLLWEYAKLEDIRRQNLGISD